MPFLPEDVAVVRDLAKRVAEMAAEPIHAGRADAWRRFNRLEPNWPMVLIFPEGSWREMLPDDQLVCTDPSCRGWEETHPSSGHRSPDDLHLLDGVVWDAGIARAQKMGGTWQRLYGVSSNAVELFAGMLLPPDASRSAGHRNQMPGGGRRDSA